MLAMPLKALPSLNNRFYFLRAIIAVSKEITMATKNSERMSGLKARISEETRQHYKKAREEMRLAAEGLLPEGFIEHRRAARREMLLAMRSLVDSALERMDTKAK
jgi:hypothetical protein